MLAVPEASAVMRKVAKVPWPVQVPEPTVTWDIWIWPFDTELETVTLTSGKTITFPKYLDGGGGLYKKYILDAIGDKKYTHAFEWCAGHGEIGFELITNNINRF